MERVERGGACVRRQKRPWEERTMSVCARPGDVYAVCGYLDAFGCDGRGYIGSASQLLLGEGMDAGGAGARVSKPTIGIRRVEGRDLESLRVIRWGRCCCCWGSRRREGTEGMPKPR